ncbi:MAG: EAL domain-containing protein [Lachnospiraceae bacterium]|nr:EAL domain-containing protein [Lachnospiraceae bacterium]
MRLTFSIVFGILIILLLVCMLIAHRSRKSIGAYVSLVLVSLIPPIVGNLILINSEEMALSTVGCYFYHLGMDLAVMALYRFSFEYCDMDWKKNKWRFPIYALIVLDFVQYALNPIFHQAFGMERVIVDGFDYFRMVPHFGQYVHRAFDYALLLSVIIIFIFKIKNCSKIYHERYISILGVLIMATIWQMIFVLFRIPVDRSMIGIAILGIFVFFFSICYRPLRVLDRMLANMASEMPQAMYFFDAFGKCIWANDEGIRFSKIKDEEFDEVTKGLEEMFGDLDRDLDDWEEQFVIGEDDKARHYAVEKHIVKDDEHITGSFLSVRDNTSERKAFFQEVYNATHDKLTGLYNKDYLYNRIQEKIFSNRDIQFLVIFLDIRNFKIINDIFGFEFGDYSIKCIADWLRKDKSSNCVYGRIAGDTFGMCIPKDEFDTEKTEAELSDFVVNENGKVHHVPIHIGVYEVEKDDTDVSVMFDRAHLAISMVADDYHDHVIFYNNTLRDKILWDQEISAQLPKALSERQLKPYLQPIVDNSGKVVGAEALVRWNHPEYGFLGPGSFIPVFEKNGLIVEVDQYMWRCACEILSDWKKKNIDMFISVNISPKDFYFTDVTSVLKEYIHKYDIDPSKLRIEITETVMMSDIASRMETLKELKNYGFVVEMDDFGSGYSSLNLLKDMPVDVLKIDMMFLSATDDDLKALTIVRNILNLSANLEISSLTEGVETVDQYRTLSELGCNLFQGYYFAKPMPLDEFENFCTKNVNEEEMSRYKNISFS